MATIKQINVNKKNALLSKGSKKDFGKLNSSKNSLKHGLTAKQLQQEATVRQQKHQALKEKKLKDQKEKERIERNQAAYHRERKYVFRSNAHEQGNYVSIHSEKFKSKDKKYHY